MNNDIKNPADTDDNLDLSVVDNSSVQVIAPIVKVETDSIGPDESKLLEQLTPVFQKVEEQASKLVTLKSLETQVQKDGNIDLVRAVVVNESFGGDLFSVHQKAGFTKVPTKVNFRETCSYMGSVVAREEAAMIDLFKTYIDEPYKGAVAVMESISTKIYPALVYVTESLISELTVGREKIVQNKNAVVNYEQGQFVNLVTDNLLEIDPAKIESNLGSLHSFRESISTVQAVFKCPVVLRYVTQRLNRPFDETGISLVSLTSFLLDTSLLQDLEDKVKQTSVSFGNMQVLVDKARALDVKPEVIAEFVLTNSRTLLDLHKEISDLLSLLYYLTFLNTAIKQMLVTYYEL